MALASAGVDHVGQCLLGAIVWKAAAFVRHAEEVAEFCIVLLERFATALSRGLVFVGCARLADLRTTVGDITGVVVVMEVPAATVKVSNNLMLAHPE